MIFATINAAGADIRANGDNEVEHVTINDLSAFKSYFDAANNVVSDDFINRVFDE